MVVEIITSSRAVSLQKVSIDISSALSRHGVATEVFTSSPILLDASMLDAGIVVMPVDLATCMPYFFVCYRMKTLNKPCIYYGTVEGSIKMHNVYAWIKREIDFVANSRYTLKKLQAVGYRVVDLVYHGIDTEFYRDASRYREMQRERLGVRDSDFLVGYIASGHKRKGHHLASKVMEIVRSRDPSIKFLVVSDGNAAKHYHNLDNVIFLQRFGSLSSEAVKALYGAMDLYSQFSLAEGFGLPVLEALACGRLVIHADYEPLSEITTPETSFRVKVSEVDSYSEYSAIRYELHIYDPAEYADVIIQAKDFVKRSRFEELESTARERAKVFDMHITYTQFIKLLNR